LFCLLAPAGLVTTVSQLLMVAPFQQAVLNVLQIVVGAL
jgi:hypothetical protein